MILPKNFEKESYIILLIYMHIEFNTQMILLFKSDGLTNLFLLNIK